ncbi:hypothetical protein Q5752_002399 [Cryptotrichosporon argae]
MSAQNYTIDDSYWATPSLALSAGWNMLHANGTDESINATQVAVVEPLLPEFWNGSLSWTSTEGASTTLTFTGTDVWAYGPLWPAGGDFTATLDNETLGTYSTYASSATYSAVILAVSGLADTTHTLELANTDDDGAWLAFDVLVVQSVAAFENATTLAAAAESAAASVAAAAAAAAAESSALAASEAAAAAAAGMTWTASELELLAVAYVFHWNAAAVLTAAVAALMGVCAVLFAGALVVRRARARSPTQRQAEPARAPGAARRNRPATRVLDAIRGRKISAPRSVSDGSAATPNSIRKEHSDAELGDSFGAW